MYVVLAFSSTESDFGYENTLAYTSPLTIGEPLVPPGSSVTSGDAVRGDVDPGSQCLAPTLPPYCGGVLAVILIVHVPGVPSGEGTAVRMVENSDPILFCIYCFLFNVCVVFFALCIGPKCGK